MTTDSLTNIEPHLYATRDLLRAIALIAENGRHGGLTPDDCAALERIAHDAALECENAVELWTDAHHAAATDHVRPLRLDA